MATRLAAVVLFLLAGFLAVCWFAGCGETASLAGPDARSVSTDTPERILYDVPRLDGVDIDGRADDWGDRGLRVDLLLPGGLPTKAADDHHATMRLGWTPQGLVVLVEVTDDVWVENREKTEMWAGDAVELFVLDGPGRKNRSCQWVISPGMTPEQPEPRWNLHDARRDPNVPKGDATPTIARVRDGGGYVLEALLPFSCMEIDPQVGRELGFHIWVDDVDEPGSRSPDRAGWVSQDEADRPVALQRQAIRLADRPSPPVDTLVFAGWDLDQAMCLPVKVVAGPGMDGKTVTVRAGDHSADLRLEKNYTGYAIGEVRLPLPGRPQDAPSRVAVLRGERELAGAPLEDFATRRAEQAVFLDIRGYPPVFTGQKLPTVEFDRPLKARALLGEYVLATTYYDREYRRVHAADDVGRYGAVVEVRSEAFPPFRRFTTLTRVKGDPSWWHIQELTGRCDLPPEMGIPAWATEVHADAIGRFVVDKMVWSSFDDSRNAVFLAGLLETREGDEGGFYADPVLADRQWWVGLKRKLYGWEETFAASVPRPVTLADGEAAPVLHEGTMAEAGMADDAPERIDAVLREWEADTDEAFAVCVARNGVIVLHKAYGTRAGQPMTVETPSKVASVTKLLSASLLMMFADRGLLDLDAPIETYLPAMKGVTAGPAVTIRHCYTHTAGTKWHWGDYANDMSERMALVFPHYQVGADYAYNGTGMALACKAMEAVSGLSQPNLFRTCLWEPLGCERTSTADAAGGGMTVPRELATLAQMLLNEGAYGHQRFFRPETFRRMLPRNLGYILGKETNVQYGLGTTWYGGNGLGEGTFGHGSATSTTIRIDPEHKLIIVMNRNGAGRNFGKYHGRFIQAVSDCMVD